MENTQEIKTVSYEEYSANYLSFRESIEVVVLLSRFTK